MKVLTSPQVLSLLHRPPSLQSRLDDARRTLYSPGGERALDALIDDPAAADAQERAHALLLRANHRARRAQARAAEDAQAALAWFSAHGAEIEAAECCLSLGLAAALHGNADSAVTHLLRARTLALAHDGLDTLAGVLNCLGFLLSDLEEVDLADRVLRQAIATAARAHATPQRMSAQSNLAQNLVRQTLQPEGAPAWQRAREMLSEALALLNDVESFRRAVRDRVGTSAALDNRAQVYLARGQPERALPLLAEAIALSSEAEDAPGVYHALVHRAIAHLALGDATAAALCAREALNPAAGAEFDNARAYDVLGDAEEELGDVAAAAEARKAASLRRRSVRRPDTAARLRARLHEFEADAISPATPRSR